MLKEKDKEVKEKDKESGKKENEAKEKEKDKKEKEIKKLTFQEKILKRIGASGELIRKYLDHFS